MSDPDILNLIVGPTRMGKTTLCHFLEESSLKIESAAINWKIEAVGCPESKRIGNQADSCTLQPCLFNNFCDLPGFNDTRGLYMKLNTILDLLECIDKKTLFRIIICVEFATLKSASGSNFINITQDLIKLFKLKQKHLSSLMIIITKISEAKVSSLNFAEIFQNDQNFIIEALKKKTISCFFFEKPKRSGLEFCFNEQNRKSIKEGVENLECINKCDFYDRLLLKSKALLRELRETNSTEISFTSQKLCLESNIIKENFLCIDEDFDLTDKELTINSSRIFILPFNDDRKINIKLKGNSKIIFSSSIKSCINAKSLIISYGNIQKDIKFPDPTKNDFDSNLEFFRLESICVNSSWTEYASHNNKFLDLIMFLRNDSDRLQNPMEFPFESRLHEIKLKLYINECMRKKGTIKNKFISMRSCQDLEDYNKTRKFKIPLESKNLLEKYMKELPSLFEILLDNKNLHKFSKSNSDSKDLHNIRSLLINRYIDIIRKVEKPKDL